MLVAVQVALPAADGTCYDSVTQLKLFSHVAVLLSADATVAVVISPLSTLVVSADQYGITALVRYRPLARTRTCVHSVHVYALLIIAYVISILA